VLALLRRLPIRRVQGCQIYLGTTYQNGKNIPNDHKMYQMAVKYTIYTTVWDFGFENMPSGNPAIYVGQI
jgi:hypothetical protein